MRKKFTSKTYLRGVSDWAATAQAAAAETMFLIFMK